MIADGGAAAVALVEGLRTMLTVSFVPLARNVAQLDTTEPVWCLKIDSNSSVEDQSWAMIDVLRVLSFGPQAAQFARPTPRLRLVKD